MNRKFWYILDQNRPFLRHFFNFDRDLRGFLIVSGTSRWHQRVFWVPNRLTRGSEKIGQLFFVFWPAVEKTCYLEVGLWFQLLANAFLDLVDKGRGEMLRSVDGCWTGNTKTTK